MPRPKVAPENRRRIQRACETCRTSKRRCDGSLPCRVCLRRGVSASCVYAPLETRRVVSTSTSSSEQQVANTTTTLGDSHYPSGESSVGSPSKVRSAGGVLDYPQSRMLYNSRGEKVYVGNVSGLSFLNFLKHALRHHLGPSQFTNEPASEWMLETFDIDTNASPVQSDPAVKRDLVECYFIASSGLLDMYTRAELETYLQLDSRGELRVGSMQSAALNIIIAIGSQSRMLAAADIEIAQFGFNYGRNIAFREQLENPSLDLIRLFLLMTFYMVGACRRHAASMYIGVASMAASTLGLHATEQYSSLSPAEASLRWRTFRSLSAFDILHASFLGRPCMTPAMTAGSPQIPEDPTVTITTFTATTATLEICHTIQNVLGSLNSGTLELATARRKCEVLKGYGKMLKQRATPHLLSTPEGRACVVGNVHASCTYYHALILVTRPSLIASLTTRLSPLGPPDSATSPSEDERGQRDIHAMSETSIDSAMHMAQTCYDAFTAGILLANMCLLKVWLFEAGLVLGFAMSVDSPSSSPNPDPSLPPRPNPSPTKFADIESAYRAARKVLKTLSKTSSLAKEYYDILSSLLQAVNMHRRQKAQDALPMATMGGKGSVERLLEFDVGHLPFVTVGTGGAGIGAGMGMGAGLSPVDGSGHSGVGGSAGGEFMGLTGGGGSQVRGNFLPMGGDGTFDFESEEWLQFANQVQGFLPMGNFALGEFFGSI